MPFYTIFLAQEKLKNKKQKEESQQSSAKEEKTFATEGIKTL